MGGGNRWFLKLMMKIRQTRKILFCSGDTVEMGQVLICEFGDEKEEQSSS